MFNSTTALANSQVAMGRKLKHIEPLSLFKDEEFSKIASIFSRLKKIYFERLSDQNCQQIAATAN